MLVAWGRTIWPRMSTLTIVLFIVGLVLLVVGADALVAGASRIAARLGISSLVIGLTVVALGTSAPELAVSITGALSGQTDLALGNAVGSNLFNVLMILGLSAIVAPLIVQSQLVRLDVPVMIFAGALCWVFALDGVIDFQDGIIFVSLLAVYTTVLVIMSRRKGVAAAAAGHVMDEALRDRSHGFREGLPFQFIMIAVGLAMLVLGSRWLVDGAVSFAQSLGISELVISLTIVAAGTSLPELATSVLAAFRGERDIAVGNVVGSSIFNIFCVLGITALIAPHGIAVPAAALSFDIPVMNAVALVCLPLFITDGLVSRLEGTMFVLYYVAYAVYLILATQQHAALDNYGLVMRWAILPLTTLTIIILLIKDIKRRRRKRRE